MEHDRLTYLNRVVGLLAEVLAEKQRQLRSCERALTDACRYLLAKHGGPEPTDEQIEEQRQVLLRGGD